MERAWLEMRLGEGRSIESIARELGRHPSTVAYWVERHGLSSAHAPRAAARGAIDREVLESLINDGLTVRQIAARVDRSSTTVRHWIHRHGLAALARERREALRVRPADTTVAMRSCRRHGTSSHVYRDGRWRCSRCNVESVAAWRRRLKQRLVTESGGRCALCGYDRCLAALQFHHLNRATKRFSLSHKGLARSYASAREEAAKCVLLCANCHAEVEAGVACLPADTPVGGNSIGRMLGC